MVLPGLASSNPVERELVMEVALYLLDEDKLPAEIAPALIATVDDIGSGTGVEASSPNVGPDKEDAGVPNTDTDSRTATEGATDAGVAVAAVAPVVNGTQNKAKSTRLESRLQQLEKRIAEQFPRLFFFVQSERQERQAKDYFEVLKKKKYPRRGIFQVHGYEGKQSEIRYFYKADFDEAEEIAKPLNKLGLDVTLRFVKYYQDRVSPRLKFLFEPRKKHL
jgi:hypothetical protein